MGTYSKQKTVEYTTFTKNMKLSFLVIKNNFQLTRYFINVLTKLYSLQNVDIDLFFSSFVIKY